jgi:hypothetical protein
MKKDGEEVMMRFGGGTQWHARTEWRLQPLCARIYEKRLKPPLPAVRSCTLVVFEKTVFLLRS